MLLKGARLVNPHAAASEHRIHGIHPIAEWVRVRPEHVRRIHHERWGNQRADAIVEQARAAGIPVLPTPDDVLTQLAGTPRHQGLVAATAPFPYADFTQIVSLAPRLLVAADQIQDPHNLGALLRTAEAVGAGGVIIPKDGSVPVTPTVEATAAGAAALVPVCRVTNLVRTLEMLKESGYWSTALVPKGGSDVYAFEPPERLLIVVGGESGIRPLVAKHCDFRVSIPMLGKIESLNASVAAGVMLYEVLRCWRQPES
jgi:23S rRNA (guanosine2251-2'-O)-methyltransferase